ncbi:MAG: trypsin-like peptidase domain-containing protein [Candidatus Zixiibacteriota bacterium]
MKGRSFFPIGAGGRYFSVGLIALGFTVLGFILASNLDFAQKSVATIPQAEYPTVKNSSGESVSPFVAVVEQKSNAVVNISVEQEAQPRYYDDFFWRFFQVPNEPSVSFGSGFFFRPDGYILTNNHVVRNAKRVVVRTATGYQYDAQVVGADQETDLAVLKVEPEESIVYIPFGNSDEIKVGDWSIAIGNPFPQQGLDRTVTVGVISAKGRSNLRFGSESPRYQDYIQTDASINPGNSGGPLLNLKGEAIGVNAAISSPSGGSVGIGFAIPINIARAIVPDLIASGRVSRGWLGIWLSAVTQAQAKRYGMDAVRGVHVDSVFRDSPADHAGIRRNDILIKFNDHDVNDPGQLSVLIATAPRNQDAQITLLRGGKRMSVTARIVDREQYQLANAPQFAPTGERLSWLGMELLDFTEQIATEKGFGDYFPGVYIDRVARGSQADRAGIQPGSIITQVDRNDIGNLRELRAIAERLRGSRTAIPILLVDPRGTIEYKAVRP